MAAKDHVSIFRRNKNLAFAMCNLAPAVFYTDFAALNTERLG
jgi:hypothetical protein